MMPAQRKRSKAKIGMAVGVAVVAGLAGWALMAGTPGDSPPFAVVDDCNAEAERAARSSAEPSELAADSLPDAGTLYGITTLNDLSAAARLAYSQCLERNGYSQAPLAHAKEQS
jgi:hypothetical protein